MSGVWRALVRASCIAERTDSPLADWEHTISFRTSAEPILNLKVFDALARATAKRKQVSLTYRKPGQAQPEQRLVDPYHLANINGEWFLFAYDHLRKDMRTFVPARIQKVQMSGQTFVRPQKFSVEKTLRDSFGVHSGDGTFAVAIRFNAAAAPYIREKRWHPSQEVREVKNGGLELLGEDRRIAREPHDSRATRAAPRVTRRHGAAQGH